MYRYLIKNESYFELSLTKREPLITNEGDEGTKFLSWLYSRTEPVNAYLNGFDTKLELLELKNIDSPSEVTLFIQRLDDKKYLPLYKYRNDFQCQNGIFYLNLHSRKEFKIDLEQDSLIIQVFSESNEKGWVINLYGEFILHKSLLQIPLIEI